MKISLPEFRDMVAEAVRRMVNEAKKKPREMAPRSEESIIAQRDRHVRALPGFSHGNVLDMSTPMGKKNLVKRQGASSMGNWTSEAMEPPRPGAMGSSGGQHLVTMLLKNGVPKQQAVRLAQEIQAAGWKQSGINDPSSVGLDNPTELGMEAKNEAIRSLVRMVVDEEIRVRRGR